VIDVDRPFLRRDAAQLAASSGSFQNQKTKAVRNRPFIDEKVIPYANATFLSEGLKALWEGFSSLQRALPNASRWKRHSQI
jgi:hypothetical protein